MGFSLRAKAFVVTMDSKLYRAAHSGDVHALQLLLPQFYSRELYSHLTPRKNTALHIAARNGHVHFINEILKFEPGISGVVNEDGNTPLHEAAEQGHSEAVNILLRHNRNEATVLNKDSESALFVASEKGHLEIVKSLLFEMDSPYELLNVQRLSDKRTPFHATGRGGHLDVVRELLAKTKEIVFNVDVSGDTPLHSSSSSGHLKIVKEILQVQPAMCYNVNESGMSALHLAAAEGHVDVVKELLSCRPDCMEIKSNNGKTALHVAVENNRVEVVNSLVKEKSAIDAQFVNEPDNEGNTALHLAKMRNSQQMVKLLTRIGKDGHAALQIVQRKMQNSHSEQPIVDEFEKITGAQGLNRTGSRIKGADDQKASDSVSAVVAGLIIQLAFQAEVSIPEWLQGNKTGGGSDYTIHVFLIWNIIAFIFSWCVLLWWLMNEKFHPSRLYRAAFKSCLYAALLSVLIAFEAATDALAILHNYHRISIILKVSCVVAFTILAIITLEWFREWAVKGCQKIFHRPGFACKQ